jgi:hypothetical protein
MTHTTVDFLFRPSGVAYAITTDGRVMSEATTTIVPSNAVSGKGLRFVFEDICLRDEADVTATMVPICQILSDTLAERFLLISGIEELASAQRRDACVQESVTKVIEGCMTIGETPQVRTERIQ